MTRTGATAATIPVAMPRVLKKYPNRRLYDTVDSRYINLSDVRDLVDNRIDFVVIEVKSQKDITKEVLLDVVRMQELAQPSFTLSFLLGLIRGRDRV